MHFPRLQHEGLIRLLVADLVDDDDVRASLATLREDIADLSEKLDEAEAMASTLPHREKYLMLAHGLSRRMLAAHLEWLDDVERELS